MSRTRKTNPPWVGRDWVPVHATMCRNYMPKSRYQRVDPDHVCNLPAEPPAHWVYPFGWRVTVRSCTWEPDLPRWSPWRPQRPEHKLYPRPRRTAQMANRDERRIRTQWRTHRDTMLAHRICVEHIPGCSCLHDVLNEDRLIPPDPRHRRQALWDTD